MDVFIFEGPKHIQVWLQRVFHDHLGKISLAGKTAINSVGIGERHNEVIDLIERDPPPSARYGGSPSPSSWEPPITPLFFLRTALRLAGP